MIERVERYNVVWDSPSGDASGSMPLGDGDVELNVWVEESGDVLLLIARSDSWDENAINMKLGRVRVKLSPRPRGTFRQTLVLRTTTIEIEIGQVRLRVWVDANLPLIHVEALGPAELRMSAVLEMWRQTPYVIKT